MGNSESTEDRNVPDDTTDANDNTDNEPSIWDRIGNVVVILESVIYIVGHISRVYSVIQEPKRDHRDPSEPFRAGTNVAYMAGRSFIEPNLRAPVMEPRQIDEIFTWNQVQRGGQTVYNNDGAAEDNDPIVPSDGEDTVLPEDTELGDEKSCITCAEHERKTIFMPCMHIALCLRCARDYADRQMAQNGKIICVVCKQDTTKIKRVFRA